jgi:hypothetical protein
MFLTESLKEQETHGRPFVLTTRWFAFRIINRGVFAIQKITKESTL